MKRILFPLLLALLASATVNAETQRARYGVAETFNFVLYNADGTLDVDEADGGTEVSLSCDEGAETTATNDFADEGTFYSIALTAAELKCERVTVVIAATTTNVFHIQTSALDNGVVAFGTAQSATATTIVLAAATSFADDILNCNAIAITGGTGAGQTKTITDWQASVADTATVSTWVTTPDNTSVYEVYHVPCSTFAADSINAQALAADAGTELGTATWASATRTLSAATNITSTGGTITVSSGGVSLSGTQTFNNTGTWTGNLTGNVSGSVGSVTAGVTLGNDAVSAAAQSAAATAEIVAALLAGQGTLTGTCDSGSTTTCVDNALTQAATSQLDDRMICFDDTFCALITDFTPGTDTVTTTKTAPDTRASRAYTIFPSTAQ